MGQVTSSIDRGYLGNLYKINIWPELECYGVTKAELQPSGFLHTTILK